jgi:hypothetical protein
MRFAAGDRRVLTWPLTRAVFTFMTKLQMLKSLGYIAKEYFLAVLYLPDLLWKFAYMRFWALPRARRQQAKERAADNAVVQPYLNEMRN